MNKWTTILKTGTFIDANGKKVEVTERFLSTLASNFKPSDREVPLVFGHPKTDDPAFGWIKALRVAGKKLKASFKQVPETVKNLVREGRYKAISVRFSQDEGRLIHVGLLGAAQPAVSGMGKINFTSEESDHTISLNAENPKEDPMSKELEARLKDLEDKQAEKDAELTELKKANEVLLNEKKEAEELAMKKDAEAAAAAWVKDLGDDEEAKKWVPVLTSLSSAITGATDVIIPGVEGTKPLAEGLSALFKHLKTQAPAKKEDAMFSEAFSGTDVRGEKGEKPFDMNEISDRV